MGDLIELSVTCSDPINSYELPSNGTCFDIKCTEGASVGLRRSLSNIWDCWIKFHANGKVIVTVNSRQVTEKELSYSLTDYTRFWYTRDATKAYLSTGRSQKQTISWDLTVPFKYISFATNQRQRASFRFSVAPLCLKKPAPQQYFKIKGGELHWKSCDDQLPDGAVIGGDVEGENVYIIRGRHRGSLIPGYFRPSKGVAYVPWGGQANELTNFEVLCGYDYEWKPATGYQVPVTAFVAGHSEDNHEPLYVGRSNYDDACGKSKVPGKVQRTHKVCYVPYNREIAVREYEVLTVPGLNVYCVNKFLGPSAFRVHHRDENYSDGDDDDDDGDDEDIGFA